MSNFLGELLVNVCSPSLQTLPSALLRDTLIILQSITHSLISKRIDASSILLNVSIILLWWWLIVLSRFLFALQFLFALRFLFACPLSRSSVQTNHHYVLHRPLGQNLSQELE